MKIFVSTPIPLKCCRISHLLLLHAVQIWCLLVSFSLPVLTVPSCALCYSHLVITFLPVHVRSLLLHPLAASAAPFRSVFTHVHHKMIFRRFRCFRSTAIEAKMYSSPSSPVLRVKRDMPSMVRRLGQVTIEFASHPTPTPLPCLKRSHLLC